MIDPIIEAVFIFSEVNPVIKNKYNSKYFKPPAPLSAFGNSLHIG